GHSSLLLAAPQRSHGPRARPRYRTAHLRWSKRKPLEIARRRNRSPRAREGNVPARASLTGAGRAVTLSALPYLPRMDVTVTDPKPPEGMAAEAYIAGSARAASNTYSPTPERISPRSWRRCPGRRTRRSRAS